MVVFGRVPTYASRRNPLALSILNQTMVMKNFFLTLTLMIAGLLALSPVSVRQARANAALASVTAPSVPMTDTAFEALSVELERPASALQGQARWFRRFLAWAGRNACLGAVFFLGGDDDHITITTELFTIDVGYDECRGIRYSE